MKNQNTVKLKLESSINSLSELEIAPINLLFRNGKTLNLIIKTDNTSQFEVKSRRGSAYFYLDQNKEAQEFYDSLYIVPKNISDDFGKLKEFILQADLDASYYFEDFNRLRFFTVSTEIDSEFCWCIGNAVAYNHPMKNANTVKHFKKEAGAKKSLIEFLERYFNNGI